MQAASSGDEVDDDEKMVSANRNHRCKEAAKNLSPHCYFLFGNT